MGAFKLVQISVDCLTFVDNLVGICRYVESEIQPAVRSLEVGWVRLGLELGLGLG